MAGIASSPPVVAIVQAAALGDLVVALPMVAAIKASIPAARVLMIAREYSRPLVEAVSAIDGYLDAEAVIARPGLLAEHGVTAFINPKQSMPLGRAARTAGVPLRIGKLNLRSLLWANRLVRVDTGGHVQQLRALLNLRFLEPLGIHAQPTTEQLGAMLGVDRCTTLPPDIRRQLDPRRFTLVLHPKSNGSGREWPAAHYDRLVDLLPTERVQVIVTGREPEREALRREGALLDRAEVTDFTGQLDLAGMIALLDAIDGFVASGTGPLHIAAAVGARTLGLFPGRDLITAARWHPLGPRGESLFVRSSCRPGPQTCPEKFCGSPCACLSDISPRMVADRILRWLDQRETAAVATHRDGPAAS